MAGWLVSDWVHCARINNPLILSKKLTPPLRRRAPSVCTKCICKDSRKTLSRGSALFALPVESQLIKLLIFGLFNCSSSEEDRRPASWQDADFHEKQSTCGRFVLMKVYSRRTEFYSLTLIKFSNRIISMAQWKSECHIDGRFIALIRFLLHSALKTDLHNPASTLISSNFWWNASINWQRFFLIGWLFSFINDKWIMNIKLLNDHAWVPALRKLF